MKHNNKPTNNRVCQRMEYDETCDTGGRGKWRGTLANFYKWNIYCKVSIHGPISERQKPFDATFLWKARSEPEVILFHGLQCMKRHWRWTSWILKDGITMSSADFVLTKLRQTTIWSLIATLPRITAPKQASRQVTRWFNQAVAALDDVNRKKSYEVILAICGTYWRNTT